MKTLIITLALLTSSLSYAETSEEIARKLLGVTGSSEMGKQMITQMFAGMKQANTQVPSDFYDRFLEKVDTDELTEMVIPIYVKHLSKKDMNAAIAFFQSSAGKNFVAKQGMIMQESMRVGQKWGMELGQKVQAEMRKEMEKNEASE